MGKTLPKLSKVFLPSLGTIFRRKNVGPEGIYFKRVYRQISIAPKALEQYRDYFNWDNEAPFSYLYLLAQRGQAHMMLDPQFDIPVPGIIHLENTLEWLAPQNFDQPFDLYCTAEVPYKEFGALIPKFTVWFEQDGQKVARCESIYLAKRKKTARKSGRAGKSTNKRHRINAFLKKEMNPEWSEKWTLQKRTGKQYARVSGDRNPIHTSRIFAKAVGFPKPIAHGWYLVSRAVQAAEQKLEGQCKHIEVQFVSPAFLPGEYDFELSNPVDGKVYFKVFRSNRRKLLLAGTLA